jgi:hypothetical protein
MIGRSTMMSSAAALALVAALSAADSVDPIELSRSPFVGPTKPQPKRSELEQRMRINLAEERRAKKAAKRLKQGKFL